MAAHPNHSHVLPTVGVIGIGRAGSAIGAAFSRAGYTVAAVHARSATARVRAKRWLPEARLDSPAAVGRGAELIIVAVPDDSIESVVATLNAQRVFREGQLVAHLSGRCGIGVLSSIESSGAVPLALHPAMTFAGTDRDPDLITGLSFGVTAPEPYRRTAEGIVGSIGGVPVWIPETSRTLYHAAMCFGANHLITLITGATEVLRAAGVAEPATLLGPLLRASLENALVLGDEALTGPVRRGDTETVAAHIEAISEAAPNLVSAYRSMAGFTAQRAIEHQLNETSRIQPVLDLIENSTRNT